MDHILVVDDDEDIRELIIDYFSSFYIVSLANNGEEGLKLFKEHVDNHPFHLVLTDVLMPGLDGVSLAKEIRKLSPDVPIIALTGAPDLEERDTDVFNELYTKPIDFREVYHKMGDYLKPY